MEHPRNTIRLVQGQLWFTFIFIFIFIYYFYRTNHIHLVHKARNLLGHPRDFRPERGRAIARGRRGERALDFPPVGASVPETCQSSVEHRSPVVDHEGDLEGLVLELLASELFREIKGVF